MPETSLPRVAVIGRPNVGKSTLLNRLSQGQPALVSERPGTTRDPVEATVEWNGRSMLLVDTGGLGHIDTFSPAVRARVEQEAETADLVLFLADGSAGLLPEDQEIATWLRRLGRPVVVGVNKVDRKDAFPPEFYGLGFDHVVPFSAAHGRGTGDLLDLLVELLSPPEVIETPPEEPPRIALLGRPNVGKSSLVNHFLSEPRLITSEEPGTTRDALDVRISTPAGPFTLVDTAGLRRPARLAPGVEERAGIRSRQAASRSQAVVLVLDATSEFTEQDRRIFAYIERLGRGTILFLNKADLVPEFLIREDIREALQRRLQHPDRYPILFGSALSGEGIPELYRTMAEVAAAFRLQLPTSKVNDVLQEAIFLNPPPTLGGVKVKIRYATQIRTGPPLIALFVNRTGALPDSYLRYLENRLRGAFKLVGVPLRFAVKGTNPRSAKPRPRSKTLKES